MRLRRASSLPLLASVCQSLAAELDAGSPPPAALAVVAADVPQPLRASLLRLAGRTPSPTLVGPLPDDGTSQGPAVEADQRLLALEVVWDLSASSGVALSLLVRRLGASLAEDVRLEAEARAALAGVRASALVVAALPLVGLVLGALLGAAPLDFLVHSYLGWGCLVGGLLLEAAGLAWLRALLARAS